MSLKVEPKESMRFHVSSADGDGSFYLVDMGENDGNGMCQCVDYGARRQKQWEATKVVKEYREPNATRCKHIDAVVMWLGNAVIKRWHA